ncbi:hypothetical protein BaRGS_00008879, partial [Batillaria attramentaria]
LNERQGLSEGEGERRQASPLQRGLEDTVCQGSALIPTNQRPLRKERKRKILG